MLKKKLSNSLFYVGIIIYLCIAFIFYWVASPNLKWQPIENTKEVASENYVGELVSGMLVKQEFITSGDAINGISIKFGTFARNNSGKINIGISTVQGELLFYNSYDVEPMKDNSYFTVSFNDPILVQADQKLFLSLSSSSEPGNAVAIWYGQQLNFPPFSLNGSDVNGNICFKLFESRRVPFEAWYLTSISIIGIFFTVVFFIWSRAKKSHNHSEFLESILSFKKYNFLLYQLIARDFKTKYRRSYLGVLWSVLNPLLMMVVVSSVFSYVFRFNIDNFSVYLILGQTVFNFLSEATNISMGSIIGSGQLIKKVYIPKYIFPLGKVIFSFLNFIISFIAIVLVLLFYKIPITKSVICLPVLLVCLFFFCLGIGLLLSASAVFFRDTLHLYGVFLTAWTYFTPIFYPVSSLSQGMAKLMMLNPMYHYIQYFRNVLLYGIFPTLGENWLCILFATVSMVLGILFFYRKQNDFILHI